MANFWNFEPGCENCFKTSLAPRGPLKKKTDRLRAAESVDFFLVILTLTSTPGKITDSDSDCNSAALGEIVFVNCLRVAREQ